MVDFTTEQMVPFVFKVADGRGRKVKIDGQPVAASSDETLATVAMTDNGDDTWNGAITAVGVAGSGRVTVTADADLSPDVSDVVGVLEFNITLDPRTAARVVSTEAGAPADKA